MKNLLLVFSLFAAGARAEVGIDDGTSAVIFKIDGKVASAVDAAKSASGHEIEKCTPIKGAVSSSGAAAVAFKCKTVVLVYNVKTGTPHWKNK